MLMVEQMYSIDEAAKALSVHPDTIRRMIRRGELAATKVGKQYRIPRAIIDEMLKGSIQEK